MNMHDDRDRLRLAVQKSGRLADETFDLLNRCGLKVRQSRSDLYARVEELEIDVLQVRDDDIPELVACGAADVGIVGGNVFEEWRLSATAPALVPDVLEALGFARCRLCIALPKGRALATPTALSGLRIATSYPALTRRYLDVNGASGATLVSMNGAHEIAPRLGLADAICDIVSTGGTLEANGLFVAGEVYKSEALLIGRPLGAGAPASALEGLRTRIRAVTRSRNAKYVMMNAPRPAIAAIASILPGADAPTVIDLAGQPDTVAIHVVCEEGVLWHHLEELKGIGARAILVLDIDKMLA